MAVIISKDDKGNGVKVLLWVIVIAVIVIGLVILWIYVVGPFVNDLFGGGVTEPVVDCVSAPNIPSGISTIPSGNSANVSWGETQNTDSYTLFLSQVNGFNTNVAERTIEVIGTTTTVINLLPVTYYFRVSAKNTCGQSNASSQASATINQWPSKVKVCKRDTPTMCLLIPNVSTQTARVSVACAGNQCDIAHDPLGDKQLSLHPGAAFCIEDNLGGGSPLQEVVTSQNCAVIPQQSWTIDLNTGRIESGSGFCLGADSIAESFAYNTTCTSLLAGDNRYDWVIQVIQ